jgi:uroporphyrinogen III methyltransferase / synthase
MEPVPINQPLANRTILVAASEDHEVVSALARQGARLISWPKTDIVDPESFATLDEAIQNLYGYDWLIFANTNAVGVFLRRLQTLSHEISELDALRVCALDEAARQQLEAAHVHVDLVPEGPATDGVLAALETYNGGCGSLRGLNFLLPRAAISRDYLRQAIEDAGARVDAVSAYRTAGSHNSELVQLGVLFQGGGIDCVVFTMPVSVRTFSQLLDTNDLSRLLKEVAVACVDQATTQAATEFGVSAQITPAGSTIPDLAQAIASYFATSHTQLV